MLFMDNIKILFKKKFIIVAIMLLLAYSAASAGIYSFSFNIIRRDTDTFIKGKMTQVLDSIIFKINYKIEKDFFYMENLSESTVVTWPMVLKMNNQMNSYFAKIKGRREMGRLILTDTAGNIVYNDSDIYKGNVDYPLSSSRYFSIFKKDSILYFHFYYPLISEGKLCGSVSSIYSAEDFSEIIGDSVKGTNFVVYTIYNRKIESSNSGLNKYVKSSDYNSSKYVFLSGIEKASETLLSTKIRESGASLDNNGIAIGIPLSSYNKYLRKAEISSISIAFAAALIFTLIVLIVFFVLKRYQNYNTRMKTEIEALKKQRHEFTKHVSIVNALAMNKNTEELKKYVSSINEDISGSDAHLRLNNKALSILISDKEKRAIKKNIRFDLAVKIPLNNLKLKDSELCTLVGNLMDNAIEASEKAQQKDSFVEVDISKDGDNYVLTVTNTGELPKERNIDKLFESGYTTKKLEQHQGLGLHIVSEIVQKYEGSIHIQDSGGRVVFSVYLPEY